MSDLEEVSNSVMKRRMACEKMEKDPQTTYCQASYLLSGKPSAVMKLATYCQASYLLSGKPSAVMKLAPNSRIHAPKRLIDMHPKSAYMHPNVSAYMHLIPHTYLNNQFF